ncbi:GlxA family transcriptional regulator [Nocardia sp. NPDC052278]|uniref:GlxA family transcriptional regulator n=1 Tax=unclassified Nocardia TaxID=2637762 RepID=UPI0036A311D3
MITHLALDGVLEGALGVGLDIIDTAAGLAAADAHAPVRSELLLAQCVVSMDGAHVRSGGGRSIPVTAGITVDTMEFGPDDVLVMPGPSAADRPRIDRLLTQPDTARAVELIRRAAAGGATVVASCSATFVLAASGLLAGRDATTTWWLAPLFAHRFPDVTVRADRMVVDSGMVLTAGAAFAHADVMLAVVARLGGPDLAHRVARYLVLDARMSQSRYMVLEHLRATDPTLRAVENHVTANLDRQATLRELASAASVSPRTLARRTRDALGMSPIEFGHRLRIAHAAGLLATTRRPIDAIAAAVGYADPAAFRRVYRRHTGETPSATRSRVEFLGTGQSSAHQGR